MLGMSFPCCTIQGGLLDKLAAAIAEDCLVWAPCQAEDGVCRLQTVEAVLPGQSAITRIPFKKLLFPHFQSIWSYQTGQYRDVGSPQAQALVGVPPCDLQALWYLDRVFAEDAHYQERRARLFVAGALCEPGPECRCAAAMMPLAGDLFVGEDRVWSLSARGHGLLIAAGCHFEEETPLPWPDSPAGQRRPITAEALSVSSHAGIWAVEGQRCLSCGACSAVCPTCYCFDLLDVADVNGSVSRQRVWDNCFFAEHGKVAGGFDFRADRAARLRFRMEHKRLGFGDLRGLDSCVGCGRCRNVCPVDIDLDRIAEQLVTEGTNA